MATRPVAGTQKWHPIFIVKGVISILLISKKTVTQLETALNFIEATAAKGQQTLFVGTKRQAKDIVREAAEEAHQPYVVERWLGGTLTNSNTINTRVKKLKDLESKMASGELAAKYNKLEVQRFQEQIELMNISFGGIKELQGRPGALFVVDVDKEATAIREANRLSIPVVAIVDTNVDPTKVTYPIACNDDAIKAIKLICNYVKDAILSGQGSRAKKVETPIKSKTEKKEK